jgi:hypothetical protein
MIGNSFAAAMKERPILFASFEICVGDAGRR